MTEVQEATREELDGLAWLTALAADEDQEVLAEILTSTAPADMLYPLSLLALHLADLVGQATARTRLQVLQEVAAELQAES